MNNDDLENQEETPEAERKPTKGEKGGNTPITKVEKAGLGVNQKTAGAGVAGLVGFFALLFVSSIFFITENYFISMLIVSFALMVYVTGFDFVKIALSSFTIFFSSRHLIDKAGQLQESINALNQGLRLRRSPAGEIKVGPVAAGATIQLPENALVRDIQKLIEDGKDYDYVEYVAHSYYVECHELYDYSHANLEFVANAMPLFGLIGTVLGLIAMFDGLGANVTVESLSPQLAMALKTTLYGALFSSVYKIISSRFDLRLKALEYDYETLCRALEVLLENKNVVEVKS